MANHTAWIAVVLLVMLVILLVKMNNLNGELNDLRGSNTRLVLQQDICRKNVRSLLASGEEKRKTAQRLIEEANRIAETIQKELSVTKEELQNKGIAYDSLQKILNETKEAVEKEKREKAKAEDEAQRYHNLYLAESMKLTSVRKAYEKLRQDMKVRRRPDDNEGESVIKREGAGGTTGPERGNAALTQKHDAEPDQLHSGAAGSITEQERNHNKTKEFEQGQQERHQQQEQQQQQEEGNKEKENEREKGRGEWNEVDAEEGEKEEREKAME